MNCRIAYGNGSRLDLEIPTEALLEDWSHTRGEPLDDPVAAVVAALEQPIDYPPLRQATVPGDRIVLALEGGVPQASAVVAGVVHTLLEGSSQPADITIVQAPEPSKQQDPRSLLQPDLAAAIALEVHDPADPDCLAYLAAAKSGNPIYLNRSICDADVVLPIGRARVPGSLGYLGVSGSLFPTFADKETRVRFLTPTGGDPRRLQQQRLEEADEAAWLLGVALTLQVVPAAGGSLLHVLAGNPPAIQQRCGQLSAAAWKFEAPQRAALVVATVEGDQDQQTWENLGRALYAASHAVRDDGAVVLCTELKQRPTGAIRRLADLDADKAERIVERNPAAGAETARLLMEARRRVRIYLLSQLDGELVEELGLGHVEQVEQITRLGRQHDSCIVLANAHLAEVVAPEELEAQAESPAAPRIAGP